MRFVREDKAHPQIIVQRQKKEYGHGCWISQLIWERFVKVEDVGAHSKDKAVPMIDPKVSIPTKLVN